MTATIRSDLFPVAVMPAPTRALAFFGIDAASIFFGIRSKIMFAFRFLSAYRPHPSSNRTNDFKTQP